jgi:hypothetical protein
MTTSEGTALAVDVREVSPSATAWAVDLPVQLVGGDNEVVVHVYLLHVDGGGEESIQFSGRSDPFVLRRGEEARPELFLVRGPLANLFATGITITSSAVRLSVGESVTLAATAATTGEDPPTIFWTSLNPSLATVSGPTVTAVADGTARIVASAGAFADSVSIVVGPPDTTPPEVVSVLPAGGATGVSIGAIVSVRFDDLLDPVSVTTTTLELRTAAGVPVTGSVSVGDSTVVFDPSTPLDTLTNYVVTLAPGIRDMAGNTRTASFQWSFTTSAQRLSIASSFNAALGVLVAIAFDPATRNLFIYDDFAVGIIEFTTSGTLVTPTIANPGTASNDHDLDFLPEALVIGGTSVGANALLVMNGEDLPLRRVYAIDKDTGAVLASVTIPMSDPVGLSYHAARNTFFGIDWTRDVVEEIDPATGTVLASFPVAPVGAPAWDTYYGDIEVDQRSGNLILVSSAQPVVRILSPSGVLLADVDVAFLDVTSMSGIAWDDSTATAWISTTGGEVFQLVGLAP